MYTTCKSFRRLKYILRINFKKSSNKKPSKSFNQGCCIRNFFYDKKCEIGCCVRKIVWQEMRDKNTICIRQWNSLISNFSFSIQSVSFKFLYNFLYVNLYSWLNQSFWNKIFLFCKVYILRCEGKTDFK